MAKYKKPAELAQGASKHVGKADALVMDKVKTDSEVVGADKEYSRSHLIPAVIILAGSVADVTCPSASHANKDLVVTVVNTTAGAVNVAGKSCPVGLTLLRSDGSDWTAYSV